MGELFETIDDPEVAKKRLASGRPIPCILLNKIEKKINIFNLCQKFYIVDIVYEGENRAAMLCGFYKEKQPEPDNNGMPTIAEKFLTFPKPCILLRAGVSLDILSDFTKLFEIITLSYEGKNRYAILCDYYVEKYATHQKPEIKSQHWRFN